MVNYTEITPEDIENLFDKVAEFHGENIEIFDTELDIWRALNTEEQQILDDNIPNIIKEKYTKIIISLVEDLLDNVAHSKGYDNIMSVRSYTGYDNPFKTECVKISNWASSVWVYLWAMKNDVETNNKPLPDIEDVMNELPEYTDE